MAEQRVIFEEMMAAIPLPADVTTSSAFLGGIPVVNVEVVSAENASVIFYLHGGAYAIGTAASSVGLASDLARRARTRLVTVDYRLYLNIRIRPRSMTSSLPTANPGTASPTAASPRPRSRSRVSPRAQNSRRGDPGGAQACQAPTTERGSAHVALGGPDPLREEHQ